MENPAGPPAPDRHPEPSGVRWHKNTLIAPMRRGALLSMVIGASMLLLASTSMATGEVTIFTLVLVFLMFYFTDNAMGRFLVSQRAPREVGIFPGGVIVRSARSEDVHWWAEVTDVAVGQAAGRYSVLTIRNQRGEGKNYVALPPHLASELKVVWLESVARRGASRPSATFAVARVASSKPAERGPAPPAAIQPSAVPAYWKPGPVEAEPAGPPAPAPTGESPVTPPPPAPVSPRPGTPVPVAPAPRPEWSFTRMGTGEATPDPRYPTRQGDVKSFQWHFLASAGSPTGAWMLMAVVVLASIVISRITADLALSLLGMSSDPWVATGIGLGVGLAIALVFYRLARAEISGEVAGSVLFLPMFDRTKADIADSLRDAGIELDAGAPRVRESRGRLILTWRDAHTRAIVMRASHESRAILLRTVGRGRFDLHQRFKGAILQRLQAGSAQVPPRPRH